MNSEQLKNEQRLLAEIEELKQDNEDLFKESKLLEEGANQWRDTAKMYEGEVEELTKVNEELVNALIHVQQYFGTDSVIESAPSKQK